MPLGDIAGEALGGVFRVIARIVFEIVVEWLLRGTGALILRVLRPRHAPGEAAATADRRGVLGRDDRVGCVDLSGGRMT